MSCGTAASVVTSLGAVGASGLVWGFVTGLPDTVSVAELNTFVVSVGEGDGLRTDTSVSGDEIRRRTGNELFFVVIDETGFAGTVRRTGEQGITFAGIAAVNVGAAGIASGEAEVVFGIGQEGRFCQQKGIVRL